MRRWCGRGRRGKRKKGEREKRRSGEKKERKKERRGCVLDGWGLRWEE